MSNFLGGKKIVLPYDFSEPAMAAIEEALSMVDDTTQVFIIHVLVPLSNVSLEPGLIVDVASDETRHTLAMEQMQERINNPEDRMTFAVRIGDPGLEIVHFAKEVHADMIIMPSHGRSGLTRLLLGSVAERVLRLSECPVLVLRHAKK